MEYEILMECSASILQATVRDYIKQGWVPSGGIAFSSGEAGLVYLQAMVKVLPVIPSFRCPTEKTLDNSLKC